MAWNPSPEVSVARDAARKLGAKTAIIVYTTPAGQLGMASYGETRTLCAEAGKCGDRLFDEATKFYSEDTP